MSGLRINELHKLLAKDPDKKAHAIIVDDLLNPNEPLIIPLVLEGFTSSFPPRKPRASVYEYESIPHIDMTSKVPVCKPSEADFA